MSTPTSSQHRGTANGPPVARRPVAFALLRQAEHVLFVGLLALGVAQSVADNARPWGAAVVGVVVLVWYVGGVWVARQPANGLSGGRAPVLWLAGLTVGWVVLVAISANFVWLVFAIFLLYLQAIALRWSIPIVLFLTASAITAVATGPDGLSVGVVVGPLTGAAVAIVITMVYRDLRDEVHRRERLMAELTAAQQRLAAAERHAGVLAERERLAHDIHDTVAQGLSSIVLLLRSISDDPDTLSPHSRGQVDAATAAAKTALEDTRRVVRALAPAGLAGQPLATALQRLLTDARPVGIDTDLEVDGEPYELPTRTAVALLRTAQGALGNVIAHSGAVHARVTLTYQPTRVSLDVADDGNGFDPNEPTTETANGTGIGLIAIRTRLAEVGGTLTIESKPAAGTAISATIPTEVLDG